MATRNTRRRKSLILLVITALAAMILWRLLHMPVVKNYSLIHIAADIPSRVKNGFQMGIKADIPGTVKNGSQMGIKANLHTNVVGRNYSAISDKTDNGLKIKPISDKPAQETGVKRGVDSDKTSGAGSGRDVIVSADGKYRPRNGSDFQKHAGPDFGWKTDNRAGVLVAEADKEKPKGQSNTDGNAGSIRTEREPVANSAVDMTLPRTQQPELCPEIPPIKETKVPLNLTKVTYDDLRHALGRVVQTGGHYAPSTCRSRERLAVIIPFRDRQKNLFMLLLNLVPFLVRQQADFTVFVVEQSRDYLFNRCLMFNVGYVLAQKQDNFTCFILHDTDLIPRDYRNLYRCHPSRPRHMMLERSNEVWRERLPYPSFIGGVLALRKEHIEKANGCSNSYYGWGLEDDDLGIRLKSNGFPVVRYPMEVGRYYSLGHEGQKHNNVSGKLRNSIHQRMKKEGLNTLTYTLLQQQQLALYTWFLVKPPPPPPEIYGN